MKTKTMQTGTRVKLAHGSRTRNWWTVRASDERFVILNRQAPFAPKGDLEYTIIDWERGVRGPCNLIGQGWDTSTAQGCDDLMRWLYKDVEVSYRNNVPAEVTEIED